MKPRVRNTNAAQKKKDRVFIHSSTPIGCPQRRNCGTIARSDKLKMISSLKRSQQRECVSSCVCFPVGQARGGEGLSLMYEKIVLYHGKSQLAVSF